MADYENKIYFEKDFHGIGLALAGPPLARGLLGILRFILADYCKIPYEYIFLATFITSPAHFCYVLRIFPVGSVAITTVAFQDGGPHILAFSCLILDFFVHFWQYSCNPCTHLDQSDIQGGLYWMGNYSGLHVHLIYPDSLIAISPHTLITTLLAIIMDFLSI